MKSEFIRVVYETQYEILREDSYSKNSEYDRKYSIRPYSDERKVIRTELICERDIDTPPLKYGDNIYDKELDATFYIDNARRNTDNTYTYEVSHIREDNEASLQRKKELEAEILSCEDFIEKIKELEDKIKEYEYTTKVVEEVKVKSWWQRVFGK